MISRRWQGTVHDNHGTKELSSCAYLNLCVTMHDLYKNDVRIDREDSSYLVARDVFSERSSGSSEEIRRARSGP